MTLAEHRQRNVYKDQSAGTNIKTTTVEEKYMIRKGEIRM